MRLWKHFCLKIWKCKTENKPGFTPVRRKIQSLLFLMLYMIKTTMTQKNYNSQASTCGTHELTWNKMEGIEIEPVITHEDLEQLGIDPEGQFTRIHFENNKTVKYYLCTAFFKFLRTIYLLPFYFCCIPCLHYYYKTWAFSRIALLTETSLVVRQGIIFSFVFFFSLFVVCFRNDLLT